ncbi:MAG: YciI family protein [Geminicoccaceae bacterium]
MAKYLYVYHGGKMPEAEAEQKAAMEAWGAWFGELGASVLDGGNPVGPSKTVLAGGSVEDHGGANPAGGYSLIEASSMDDAVAKAKGCPIFSHGGNVEVAEAININM